MKQHLQRQSGVANVDVSLIDGKVEVTPKEDGRIDPAQLLRATYDSGVSVAELDMTATGKVVKDASGNLLLQVNTQGEIETPFDRSVDIRFSSNESHTLFSHRAPVVV